MSSYKFKHSFKQRSEDAMSIKEKHPDRIPIICEIDSNHRNDLLLLRTKYLVPKTLTLGHFLHVVRKQIKLRPEEAIFIIVDGTTLPQSSLQINDVYEKHKDLDGFLYLNLARENVFGS